MILYHGSNIEVSMPKIIKSERGKDFGFAFYLTPIKEQAERMAKRKYKQMKIINPDSKQIVSVFEWNEDIATLKYKNYSSPNEEWLDMILKCRSDANYSHGFDIVKGKIADDSVGETVGFVLEGIMRKEDAIEKLKFQKINSQIAFCTEQSLESLRFIKSYEVK